MRTIVIAALAMPAFACGDDSTATPDAPRIECHEEYVCEGNLLVHRFPGCEGRPTTSVYCREACVEGTPPECINPPGLLPSGILKPGDFNYGTQEIVLDGDVIVNTETGEIRRSDGSHIRGTSPGVIDDIYFESRAEGGVFASGALRVTGSVRALGDKPMAWASWGPITVDGVVDLRGSCLGAAPGPGGVRGGSVSVGALGDGGGAGAGADVSAGGGGGGHGGLGGTGGRMTGTGVAGGTAFGTDVITSLVGGAGGGGGGGAAGGGGGGAIQLASNSAITISSTGGINAGGCGGSAATTAGGGGGGGAGGTILLEAPTMAIAGVVAANGGGGGGGNANATAGAPGSLDRVAAGGGAAGDAGGGAGGAGAAGATLDGVSAVNASYAGGGGGAIGRIRFNTYSGSVDVAGQLSPSLDDSPTTCTVGVATTE